MASKTADICFYCDAPVNSDNDELAPLCDKHLAIERAHAAAIRLRKQAKPLADAISGFTNRGERGAYEALVDELLADHPTLVQAKADLFLLFFQKLAETQYTDLRNEAAVKIAKKIMAATEGTRLPRY